MNLFEVAIIGSGPAGMSAAIYAQRFNLSVVIFENSAPGGAMVNTEVINNYPGFSNVGGAELSLLMYQQMMAASKTLNYVSEKVEIVEYDEEKNIFHIICNKEYYAKTVIIATGTYNRVLGLPTEAKFFYKGISWCAICDGPLYRNLDVAVIGGGNSALSSAITLAKMCNKVYLIHRRNEFRAAVSLQEKVKEYENIEVILDTNVTEFIGNEKLEAIKVENSKTLEQKTINISCVFEMVGKLPNTDLVKGLVKLTPDGYIIADNQMVTSKEGIYACGDVVYKKVRQIATAVSDGAVAAISVNNYLK